MSVSRKAYTDLVALVRKAGYLRGVNGVLEWDQQVVMPPKGSHARGEQMAVVSGLLHQFETDPKINELLSEIEQKDMSEFNEYEVSNLKLIRKSYDKKVKVPTALVEESSRLSAEGFRLWVEAKKESNFAKFAPILKKWIDLRKQIAGYTHPGENVYDAMLDDYEPELTTKQITEVFERVKETLVPFLAKIREKKDSIDGSFMKDEVKGFDVKLQEQLSRRIAADVVQYNFEQGRIDVSAHPFTIGIDPQDVRITTRYQNNEFLQGLAGTIHEAGHALYEMQLNLDYAGQPVQQPLSMGAHESQSLFWERHILLSKSFWQKHWSLVRETFPHVKEVSDDQVYKAANVVEFSNLIRVESDEVTYPLHIILRFEIERDLFSGAVQVDDLPKVWNEKMKQYLGIEPPTDAQGVLQDVHWSSGAFGYFPTYSLGAMYAAQIAAQPVIAKYVENGQYKEICQWLKEKIHTRGSVTLNANRLLKEATGEELNVDHFVKYLKDKYSEIYSL